MIDNDGEQTMRYDAEKLAKLEEELQAVYGEKRGAEVFQTVMPNIAADFHKTLGKAKPNTTITEEYRLDDGMGTIVLSGQKKPTGERLIERYEFRK